MNRNYKKIIKHYNNSFENYGFSLKAMNWKSQNDNNLRFKIASQYISTTDKSILDFGCGTSLFFKFLKRLNYKVKYTGIDTNYKVIEYCKKKFPLNKYYCNDILEKKPFNNKNSKFDIIFANGIFTQRLSLSNKEMYSYLVKTIGVLNNYTKNKIIFNVLTDQVDWKNKKNFYISIDKLTNNLRKKISKKLILRFDYNKYEIMIIVFK